MDESLSQGRLLSFHQGTLAEHLVCADLIKSGHPSFMASPGLRYDIIMDTGSRLLKVQVKSTYEPKFRRCGDKLPGYTFKIKKHGRTFSHYSANEFDIMALVALDINQIAYLTFEQYAGKAAIRLRQSKAPNAWSKNQLSIHDYPISKALECL